MHSYLRAIGFSQIKKKKDIDQLIQNVVDYPDGKMIAENKDGEVFVEYVKDFSEFIGLSVRGEYDENDHLIVDYYYPYFKGTGITTEESIEVEKHAAKVSYAGVCDEIKIGVTLIFYLQNVAAYLNEMRIKPIKNFEVNATLSALSISGTVLLPISIDEIQSKSTEQNSMERNHLIAAARDGDEDAIESLTLEDIDMYSMISRRILHEDIFSIVESYFMPYGIESDQYSILGEIRDYRVVLNHITKEELYVITVNSNELIFDLCINKVDLMGIPEIGRRFKGIIWMQGNMNFLDEM